MKYFLIKRKKVMLGIKYVHTQEFNKIMYCLEYAEIS